ncbi:AAA family ATPase [Methanococcus maripaludis]|uniref:SpoVK/Ycf46/Vps4 family AAA+-type ATPase n=1 Tax=Methanococcus maripaludis TaxID=39152 RepID=A0A7J9PDV9_METMI|nr:ATP-binding protein [Methanococcus maripaludis]MBA2860857.1 SpoVK/Ycf46/Vps4 family AAA+-type ATPase [Methanococcus maripaludis]
MEYLPEILKIIEGGLQKDEDKVFNYGQMLIKKLDDEKDERAANQIRKIISKNKSLKLKSKSMADFLKIPVDIESRMPLAELTYVEPDSVLLSLNNAMMANINEYINLMNNYEDFTDRGIKLNRTLLLFGPPGTGKTQTAKYIASKTKLPLITVRIDGIISSYLGNTSKNIRALFDFVQKTPCILFLDEVDALAKLRDDSNELGELKRVVNTLLQNIDSLESKIPIIAATNHEHLLDSAVWRRFEYKLKIEAPDKKQREYLVKEYLKNLDVEENLLKMLVVMTKGFSGAELEVLANVIKTSIIMENKQSFGEKDLMDNYIKYQIRNNCGNGDFNGSDEKNIRFLKICRGQDPQLFTLRNIAKMTGLSLGKVSKMVKEGVD